MAIDYDGLRDADYKPTFLRAGDSVIAEFATHCIVLSRGAQRIYWESGDNKRSVSFVRQSGPEKFTEFVQVVAELHGLIATPDPNLNSEEFLSYKLEGDSSGEEVHPISLKDGDVLLLAYKTKELVLLRGNQPVSWREGPRYMRSINSEMQFSEFAEALGILFGTSIVTHPDAGGDAYQFVA